MNCEESEELNEFFEKKSYRNWDGKENERNSKRF